MMDDLRQRVIEQFTWLPDSILEVGQLTDRDRVALCIAAGVGVDMVREEKDGKVFLKVTTRTRCGIVKVDGRFRVFEEHKPKNEYLHVPLERVGL